MGKRTKFAFNEYYHCYNRGADKRVIFETDKDYQRFLLLLYLCNDTRPVHLRESLRPTLTTAVETPREQEIVEIIAYTLMPNHYHLLLREIQEGGITRFMRKLGTAYTMYFNTRRNRTGVLFQGKFRAKHVPEDGYLQRLIHYIHLNPAKLCEPHWNEVGIQDMDRLEGFLSTYPYSSLPDLYEKRLETVIVSARAQEINDATRSIRDTLNSFTVEDIPQPIT